MKPELIDIRSRGVCNSLLLIVNGDHVIVPEMCEKLFLLAVTRISVHHVNEGRDFDRLSIQSHRLL